MRACKVKGWTSCGRSAAGVACSSPCAAAVMACAALLVSAAPTPAGATASSVQVIQAENVRSSIATRFKQPS
ncbi:hypothetical protein [Caenimonas sedimenti]|uniref:hypothetical protein n=1 Tax=Caenimonas sedimenti TaxID=2596921 RepID=UPI002107D996|nr:hypothetical protein [Caenimonas sedimenti]